MKKRYWLRGGVVGLLLFCIGIGLVILVLGPKHFQTCITSLDPAQVNQSDDCGASQRLLGVASAFFLNYVTLLVFTLGGTFIGYLYGILKNRRAQH